MPARSWRAQARRRRFPSPGENRFARRRPCGVSLRSLAPRYPLGRATRARPLPRPSEANNELDDHEHESAVSILAYMTTWCPDCLDAQKVLKRSGLPYTLVDVESVPGAEMAMLEAA